MVAGEVRPAMSGSPGTLMHMPAISVHVLSPDMLDAPQHWYYGVAWVRTCVQHRQPKID